MRLKSCDSVGLELRLSWFKTCATFEGFTGNDNKPIDQNFKMGFVFYNISSAYLLLFIFIYVLLIEFNMILFLEQSIDYV